MGPTPTCEAEAAANQPKHTRMDLGIRDRVAIVAASSRGLGKAVATALAAEGARVAVCY